MKYLLLLLLPFLTSAQCVEPLKVVLKDNSKGHGTSYPNAPSTGFSPDQGALHTAPALTIADTVSPLFTFSPGGWAITENDVVVLDCFPFEEFTEWTTDGKPKGMWAVQDSDQIRVVHRHDWVYAEHSDVNQSWIDVQTAMYCPCGCPKVENQARICRVCLEHQTRTRTYGNRPRTTESEYIKLKKKAGQ